MSTITIEIPDSILEILQTHYSDLQRFLLEVLAVEGYRRKALTQQQVGEMLKIDFSEVEAFLKSHDVNLHQE